MTPFGMRDKVFLVCRFFLQPLEPLAETINADCHAVPLSWEVFDPCLWMVLREPITESQASGRTHPPGYFTEKGIPFFALNS